MLAATLVVPPAARTEMLAGKAIVCADLAVRVNGSHAPDTLVP